MAAVEIETSTKGHWLSILHFESGEGEEPQMGIQQREGFFRITGRLNLAQLDNLFESLLQARRKLVEKSKGQQ